MIVNQLISLQIADAHRQLNQTETVDSAECTSRIRPGAMQGQVVCYAKLSQARSPQQTVQVEGHTPSHCNVTVSTYTIHKLWSNCENIVIIYFLYVQLYYTYCNIQTYVLYIYIYILLHYVHTKSIAIKLLVQLLHYVCHSPSQYLLLFWPKGVASWSFLNFLHFAPWNISSCSSYPKPTLLSWWDTKRLETFARTRNIQQPHHYCSFFNMQWRTKPTEQNSVEGTSNVWRPAIRPTKTRVSNAHNGRKLSSGVASPNSIKFQGARIKNQGKSGKIFLCDAVRSQKTLHNLQHQKNMKEN